MHVHMCFVCICILFYTYAYMQFTYLCASRVVHICLTCMYICASHACTYVLHMRVHFASHACTLAEEAKKWHHIAWNLSYRQLCLARYMLATKVWFCPGSIRVLNWWVISPAPRKSSIKCFPLFIFIYMCLLCCVTVIYAPHMCEYVHMKVNIWHQKSISLVLILCESVPQWNWIVLAGANLDSPDLLTYSMGLQTYFLNRCWF